MKFFDAHTHVQFAAYDADRKETIKRALQAGVSMINVGTQADTSATAVKLANEYESGVYAAVGLHPIHTEQSFHDESELGLPVGTRTDADDTRTDTENFQRESAPRPFTSRAENFDYDYYKKLALDPKTLAIGECGLDYYHLSLETRSRQAAAFVSQMELAHEVKKPLMIHCRNAFPDLIEILKTNHSKLSTNYPGVVHFFTGTSEDAEKLMELGFSFTFGGAITFPPRKGKAESDYDEVIRMLPLDRILTETDAPYVAPVSYRGKRNEPAYVVEIAKKIAELKNAPLEEVSSAIMENARRIFRNI